MSGCSKEGKQMKSKLFGKEIRLVDLDPHTVEGIKRVKIGSFNELGIPPELLEKEKQMNMYEGFAQLESERGPCEVTVNGQPLPPRNDLFNHSPDGFQWGYHGSGPAQLALAILAFEFGNRTAITDHQKFKRDVIATLQIDESWTLTSTDLLRWRQSE